MNLPNILTLSRVPAKFAIVALMYRRWTGAASIAFWLFIAGAVSDWLDGYVARKQGIVSDFGKLMDALTDKIMVIGIMVALVDRNYVPIALVLVTLCREFMVSGLRMLAAAKGVVVPADRGGKTKTLTQLISIGFLLGSTMARQDWATWLPWRHWDLFADIVYSIGWVGFALSTLLAIWSGYRYFMNQRSLWVDC